MILARDVDAICAIICIVNKEHNRSSENNTKQLWLFELKHFEYIRYCNQTLTIAKHGHDDEIQTTLHANNRFPDREWKTGYDVINSTPNLDTIIFRIQIFRI